MNKKYIFSKVIWLSLVSLLSFYPSPVKAFPFGGAAVIRGPLGGGIGIRRGPFGGGAAVIRGPLGGGIGIRRGPFGGGGAVIRGPLGGGIGIRRGPFGGGGIFID
jgi:hypothetical protein